MKKIKLKEIKDYVSLGLAEDVSLAEDLPECYEKVAISRGTYGINGGLFTDKEGNLYAITKRNSNLFRVF